MNTFGMGRSSRLIRRLLVFVWVAILAGATGAKADPAKTLIQDTLFRADGSFAQGTVTIRWNSFSTTEGDAVAAGGMTVSVGANGGISIPLIPNTGATPAGGYYKVVVKLDDGTTSEELWVVPATATTTIAAIRAKVVPQSVAAQFVSRDYIDSVLAGLTPSSLVHTTGAETIQGTKTFVSSPEVPVPTDAGGAANKGYVDQAVPNLGAPGTIGGTTPGAVNATTIAAQSVNGVVNAGGYFSIQAAINALPAAGGKVEIPAGTYNLSSEILVATASGGQYEICGAGPGTVLNITGTNGALHVTGNAGGTASQVKLCDMTVVSNSSGTAAFGIHLDGIAHFTLQDINCLGNGSLAKCIWQTAAQQGEIRGGYLNPGGTGVAVYQEMSTGAVASNGTEIHGVSMNGGGTAIYQNGVDSSFIHSNHITSFSYGLYVAAGGVGPPTFQDNHVESITVAGVYSVGYARILNNNFFITGGGAARDISCATSCVISGNLLQAGVTFTTSGAMSNVVEANQVNSGAIFSDAASDTVYRDNYGMGANKLPHGYGASAKMFTFTSTSPTVGDIASFVANGNIGGSWGVSIFGAGSVNDTYLKIQNVALTSPTNGGGLNIKSADLSTTYANFGSTGLTIPSGLTISTPTLTATNSVTTSVLNVTGAVSTAALSASTVTASTSLSAPTVAASTSVTTPIVNTTTVQNAGSVSIHNASASGDIAVFNPYGAVAGANGITVLGAGAVQDIYLRLNDVILAGSTTTGVLNFKSGVGGNQWMSLRSSGLGIGPTTPNPSYTLDVQGNGVTLARIGGQDDYGFFFNQVTSGSDYLLGFGTRNNGAGYTAKHTAPASIENAAGTLNFAADSGLTVGSTFTPTKRVSIPATGGLQIWNGANYGAVQTSTLTANRNYTFPDASITVSGATAYSCGTTSTCMNTNTSASVRFVYGSVTLSAGSATVAGIAPAFSSAGSFVCTGTDQSSVGAVKIANASTSSFVITGVGSDVVGYQCVGN